MNTASTGAMISIAALAAGCGSSATPTPKTTERSSINGFEKLARMPKSDGGTIGMVSISDDVKSACGISDDEAYFAFNSANVRPGDMKILDKLRDCFTTGKLKGHTMQLVGHADPRGDDSYNLALGGKRADNVKKAIVDRGMPTSRVLTSSRGAMDATGTDESTWAKDRRVDVQSGG